MANASRLEHVAAAERKIFQAKLRNALLECMFIGPFGRERLVRKDDLVETCMSQITVRIGGHDCAVMNGWFVAGTTLLLSHFSLSKGELAKLGYGKAVAEGLANLASTLGITLIVFNERDAVPEHVLLFQSLRIKRRLKKARKLAGVWTWRIGKAYETRAEAGLARALVALMREVDDSTLESALKQLRYEQGQVAGAGDGALLDLDDEFIRADAALSWGLSRLHRRSFVRPKRAGWRSLINFCPNLFRKLTSLFVRKRTEIVHEFD